MALSSKPSSLTESTKAYIAEQGMIPPSSRVIVGVSGGPDSMALMHVLHALSLELDFQITVAHLDHSLRGDSALDAEFTARAAAELGLHCSTKRLDVKSIAKQQSVSLEEAGRIARYEFFSDLAQEVNASKIATAHHLDDEIETHFLRIFRGSSLQGLQGIRPMRGPIIRPFIRTTRSEILDFLNCEGIEFRLDPTNLEERTDRNFVRNRIIPIVQVRFPSFRTTLARTMDLLRKEEGLIDSLAGRLYDESARSHEHGLSLKIAPLREAPSVLVSRVILSALYQLFGPQIRIGRIHVDGVESLIRCEKPSGQETLPGRILVQRSYGEIVISRVRPKTQENIVQVEITGPGNYKIPGTGFTIRVELLSRVNFDPRECDGKLKAVFDAKYAGFPLILRGMLPGDRLEPWGMEGSRKLKDIFIDMKIPREQRGLIPLLVKGEEILWVAGIRRGRGDPVTESTTDILEIDVKRNDAAQNGM
jgi:tRNA(Ile)-lysidine synthase